MERSRLSIDQWWRAAFVLSDYNKEVAVEEMRAAVGVTYKSALRLKRLMVDVWQAQEEHKRTFGKTTSDLWLKRYPPPETEKGRKALWHRRKISREERLKAGSPSVRLRPTHADRLERTAFMMKAIVLQDPEAPGLKKQRNRSAKELRKAKRQRAPRKLLTSLQRRTTTAV